MTLIYELDLDILKLYLSTEMNFVCRSRFSNVTTWKGQTDTQIHTQTDATKHITTPHLRVVIKSNLISINTINQSTALADMTQVW